MSSLRPLVHNSSPIRIGYTTNMVTPTPQVQTFKSLESYSGEIMTTGHPQENGTYASGGAFYLYKKGVRHTPSASAGHYWGENIPTYVGSFTRDLPARLPCPWTKSYDEAYFHGAEAMKRARPARPDFTLATELFELRDLPSLFKQEIETKYLGDKSKWTSPLKDLGKAHLYMQFGWLPLLRSIRDFTDTHRNQQKIVDQLFRDNGRPVRRRGTILDVTNTSSTPVLSDGFMAMKPVIPSQIYLDQSSYSQTITTERRKVWYSGRFRYYLPEGPRTVEYQRALLRGIYGLSITPASLYNAMPWSWLIDYFTNLGDILDNLSSSIADRVICDYCYVMSQREFRQTVYSSNYTKHTKNAPFPLAASKNDAILEYFEEEKIREAANPFGFRVSVNDLSPTQLAIMGALGSSRL